MECVVDSCGNVQHEALLVMMEDEDELEENDLRDEEDEEEPIVNTNPKTKNHGRNEANDDIDVEVDYLIEEFEDDEETVLQLGGGIGGDDEEEESEKPPTTITTKKKAVTFSDEEIQAFRDQVGVTTSGSNDEENIPPEYAAAAAAASGGGEGTTTTVSAIPLASVLLSRTRSPFKSRKKKKAIPADTASTSDWRPPMSKPPSKVEMPPPQRERPIKKIQKLFPTKSKRKVKQAPSPPSPPIKEEDSYKEDNTIAESVVVMQGDDELLEGTSKRQSKVKVFEITVFPNQRLGLTVHSYGFIKEVFATSIFKNEINALTDQVIEVNGIDLSKKVSDEILKTLQSLDPVKPKIFKIKRENPAFMTIQESQMVDQEEDVAEDMKYNILADLRSKYLCDFGEIPWELRF